MVDKPLGVQWLGQYVPQTIGKTVYVLVLNNLKLSTKMYFNKLQNIQRRQFLHTCFSAYKKARHLAFEPATLQVRI